LDRELKKLLAPSLEKVLFTVHHKLRLNRQQKKVTDQQQKSENEVK